MARPRLFLLAFCGLLAFVGVSCGPHPDPNRAVRQVRPQSPTLPPLTPRETKPVLSTELMATRPVARIPSGTVVGKGAPEGWTHLVLLVHPRLGSGDVSALPHVAARYTQMFQLTILARTKAHTLDHVALGYAVDIDTRKVVITSTNTQGAPLDFIGRRVFEKNELMLGDLVEVGRSSTSSVFDAPAIVLRDGKHARMIYRHLIRVGPDTGKLAALVWLMEPGQGGEHVPVDAAVLLPPGLREDRVLNVKKEKISTFGVPADDALALVGLPKEGTPVPFTPALRQAGAHRRYSPATLAQLDEAVREALRSASRGR